MATPARTTLSAEPLEDRATPAVTFRFDYGRDLAGLFADPARRQMLERVGTDIGNQLGATLAPILPTAGSWTAKFYDPATGGQFEVPDLAVGANELVIFVGGRDLPASEAGAGGMGGYRIAAAAGALSAAITDRNPAGVSRWGGSIAFDTDQNWYFGRDAAGLTVGQVDFYTVAAHELAHAIGLGTAVEFQNLIVGNTFTGATATSVNGGPVQLASDLSHFVAGTEANGEPASVQPFLISGQRYGLSALDFAALSDIGWQVGPEPFAVSPISPPVTPPTPTVPDVPVAVPIGPPATTPAPSQTPGRLDLLPPGANTPAGAAAVSGAVGGSAQLLDFSTPAQPAAGAAARPFPDFGGVVRTALADVTGDGVPDVISAVGPGGGSRVRVTDGATMTDAVAPLSVFEPGYTGGVFVAAADFDRDGRAEILVTADRGGGGRVAVVKDGRVAASFMGIDDANFRGGARPAVGDVTGDGIPDVIVGAGFGGGPRVAIFDGTTVFGTPRRAVADFFAFDGADATRLRNGVFPAAGDLTGDGRADLVFGGGPGGGPRVVVLNGALVAQNADFARQSPVANFFAFTQTERGGVHPLVRDADGDGKVELLVGSGEGSPAAVKVFAGETYQVKYSYAPFGGATLADGVYVG